MRMQTKTFTADAIPPISGPKAASFLFEIPARYRVHISWFQLIVAYVFMERALWSSHLAFRNS